MLARALALASFSAANDFALSSAEGVASAALVGTVLFFADLLAAAVVFFFVAVLVFLVVVVFLAVFALVDFALVDFAAPVLEGDSFVLSAAASSSFAASLSSFVEAFLLVRRFGLAFLGSDFVLLLSSLTSPSEFARRRIAGAEGLVAAGDMVGFETTESSRNGLFQIKELNRFNQPWIHLCW